MLAYSENGKGNTVVLIHGFCENRSMWDHYVKALVKEYRVICVDLPGFGESEVQSDISIDDMAADIKILLDELGVERCAMIGHSLGGYVTLSFESLFPHMLVGYGLFHSTAYTDSEEKKASRLKTIEFLEQHGMEPFAEPFVIGLFHEYRKNDPNHKMVLDMVLATDVLGAIEASKAMRERESHIETLTNTGKPVWFAIGKQDGAVPLDSSLEQCHLPFESHVHIFDNMGHMGMIEHPRGTYRAMKAFLDVLEFEAVSY